MSKFVQANCNQPFLLPPDSRDRLPDYVLAYFIVHIRKALKG